MKGSFQTACAFLLLWLHTGIARAQLVTTGGGPVSANALVSNLVGQGVSFSNATYTGRDVAIGTFNGTASNIGLNSGVIITSGHIQVAPGPNNNGGASYSNNGPNIPELQTLAQSVTYDGAILEFDFVPQSNFISFRYVFASEEYNEYVCSEFNDAFAFFITGPGIVGAENLAVVPSTSLPVTINTINNGVVGALGSASNSPCVLGNSSYFIGNTLQTVQYDGFTTVLTAQRSVIPCQTYHIRLMIADGADDIFDSAVFLEENSFNSATYAISLSTPLNDSSIYEGCTAATITFSRPNADPSPLTINYSVGGTASPGVDYPTLPGTVVIPAGQTEVSFQLTANADALNEGIETIIITGLTSCGDVPVTLYLKEKPPLMVTIPTQSLCNGNGPVTLNAQVTGGIQPYTYLWDNGATTASIQVNPATTTTYQVEVTDYCGTKFIRSTTVAIVPVPTASIGAPPMVCSGVPVTVAYTGTASPAATYIWDFDNPSSLSSGSDQGPYQVSWDSSGIKTISVQVIENGCSSQVVSVQTVVNPTPTTSIEVDPLICAGQTATVTYTGTGTDMGGYGWGFPGGVIITGGRRGPFEIRWDSAGVYGITLTVTENGCTSPAATHTVTVQPSPTSAFTVTSPVCVGEASLIQYAGQASSSAVFNWNFAGGTVQSGSGQGPYSVSWNSPGTKNVFLSLTENGCTSRITHVPVVVNPNPSGNFSVSTPLCEGQTATVTYTGTAATNAQYQWNFDGATVVSGSGAGPYQIVWNQAGAYLPQLQVNDLGCSSGAYQYPVLVNPIPSASFTVTGPVCTGEAALVTYTGTLGNSASFNWDFNGAQVVSGSGPGPYSIYWDSPGTRQITLSLTSAEGCPSQPEVNKVLVKPTPTATFTAETPVCINEASTLIYTGSANPGASYQWNFSGGRVVSGSGQGPMDVLWTSAGIKNISLSVTENGCTSPEFTQQVRVKSLPTGFFTASSPVCAGSPANIMYSGSAASSAVFDWDFNQGNVLSGSGPGPYQVSWDSEGPKPVTLRVVEDGCSSVVEIKHVIVNPVPTNPFTVEGPLCLNEASAIVYTGNAFVTANYIWDFDGGTVLSGNGRGPYQVSWSSPGQKQVSLRIEQSGCPSIPASRSVMVHPIPEAPFQASVSVCTGQEADVLYTGFAGPQASYNWNFNGATILSGSGSGPFKVMWNQPGEKKISLQVEANGCLSLPGEWIATVHAYPQAQFETEPIICQGAETEVVFSGSAEPEALFAWNFGGATVLSGSGRGPYRLSWDTPGDKTITLNLSQHGCVATPAENELKVAPSPEANAGADHLVCSGDTVKLGASPVPGYAYSWRPAQHLNQPFSSSPDFWMRNQSQDTLHLNYVLVATLGQCSDFDTIQVSVKPEPIVQLQNPASQCLNENQFHFNAYPPANTQVQYQWDFGPFANNRYSQEEDPANIRYAGPGVFPYTLRFQVDGCPGMEIRDSVRVNAMPEVNFTGRHLEGCPPLKADLTNQSVLSDAYQYLWDMGDGTLLNGYQPDYSYQKEGQYSVTLRVVNEAGCSASLSIHSLINVYPVPQAGFRVNPEELSTDHPQAIITDESEGAVSWRYMTGTGEAVYQPGFTWLYNEPGSYQISQLVTNQYGCKDSTLKKLNVKPVMTFYIPNAFTPNNDGNNDYFKCYGLNIKEFSMSIFNRWGQLVFYSEDIDEAWDGRLNNEPDRPVSQMDVYAVLVYVKDTPELPARRIDHRVTLVK